MPLSEKQGVGSSILPLATRFLNKLKTFVTKTVTKLRQTLVIANKVIYSIYEETLSVLHNIWNLIFFYLAWFKATLDPVMLVETIL